MDLLVCRGKSNNSGRGRRHAAFTCRVEDCLGHPICIGMLTISLLSMPTFRRLPATEPMSRSFSQDLKSFTAKADETPRRQRRRAVSGISAVPKESWVLGSKKSRDRNSDLENNQRQTIHPHRTNECKLLMLKSSTSLQKNSERFSPLRKDIHRTTQSSIFLS